MQPTSHQASSHMTIKLINHRPVLVVPKLVSTCSKSSEKETSTHIFQSGKNQPTSYLHSSSHQATPFPPPLQSKSLDRNFSSNDEPNGSDLTGEYSKLASKKEEKEPKDHKTVSFIN